MNEVELIISVLQCPIEKAVELLGQWEEPEMAILYGQDIMRWSLSEIQQLIREAL